MRGISSEPKKYILKADRKLPKKEQTIWWLKPLKTVESTSVTVGILNARQEDEETGDVSWDESKYQSVELDQFLKIVAKVENYYMSPDNPKFHKDGFRDYEGKQTLTAVYEDLTMSACSELLQAASGNELTEEEQANLDSKSTSSSGEAKK